MSYNSLEIYKRTSRSFTLVKDGVLENESGSNEYDGIFMGNYLYIKTGNGAVMYNQVPYSVITYIDEVEGSAPETFTNAFQAFDKLKQVGFLKDSTTSGGSGSTQSFIDLDDVNVSTLAGRQGQYVKVNETGTALITAMLYTISRITEALDYLGGALTANKYLATNASATGFILADIDLIINRPIGVDEFRVIAKGINPDTGNPNIEDFVKEPGDWCEGVSSIDGYKYELVYDGGDETQLSSYTIMGRKINPNIN